MSAPLLTAAEVRAVFVDWFAALRANPRYAEVAEELEPVFAPRWALLPEGERPLDDFCAVLGGGLGRHNFLPVVKSNYLYRRLYHREAHRVEPCPKCEGSWGRNLGPPDWGCKFCGSTGWLP